MEVEDFTTDGEEGLVVAGMVMHTPVVAAVAQHWASDGPSPGLFASRWANLVGWWSVQYYKTHGTAPGRAIDAMADAWAAKYTGDPATVDMVDDYLSNIGDQGTLASADYLVDRAGHLVNSVALLRMADRVRLHVDQGDLDAANKAARDWGRLELGVGAGIEMLRDEVFINSLFTEDDNEVLVQYPGGLGKFFGKQLARDEFVALTGSTGRGKTWWLLDIAAQGLRTGSRVAFFEVGDMSAKQIGKRFAARLTGRPTRGVDIAYPVTVQRPQAADAPAVVTRRPVKHYPAMCQADGQAMLRRFKRRGGGRFRLSVHSNGGISVAGIRAVLEGWARQGWVPDVVVVDYADVLAPLPGWPVGDRGAINATWAALRALSQDYHCLVTTATQADAASYDAALVRRSNFSDDRRKNDHVTAMVGINQTPAEKEDGVYRLNYTKRREEVFAEGRCVYVASCLALGRAHVCSDF